MFRSLRVKRQTEKIVPDSESISAEQLQRDPTVPVTLRQVNNLPLNARRRVYRALLPPRLLADFQIDPVSWKAPDGDGHVSLAAEPGTSGVMIGVRNQQGADDEVLRLEISDNAFNGVDLNFIIINDPDSPRYDIDRDEEGRPTLFGTARRNLAEEERAMEAGLAPAQSRGGLRASGLVLDQLEAFLATLGHRAYFLEPLTYASAWVFERRGFAYVRGHKLMDDIHQEFQPGGKLHRALDGSTPFRQPDGWDTVRSRAWAIHDGILSSLDTSWNGLRMVKRVGQHAGVETFPGARY
jgi:hypothetical protein